MMLVENNFDQFELKKNNQLILSIETSCDETAVAVTEGSNILSNIVASQIKDHIPYGGVVPELASRKHVGSINYLIEKALDEAKINFIDLDAIAVTNGPGLVGALMIGVAAAKALAFSLSIPLIAINHVEAHIFSIFQENEDIRTPFVCLIASGGHTILVLVHALGKYELLGQTLDDAAGEAFDKVAKFLHLPYPGGPQIENIAKTGDENKYKLPRPLLNRDDFNFSFSGLKTAIIYAIRNLEREGQSIVAEDMAASFQKALCEVLVIKALKAARKFDVGAIAVVGGVASNNYLRKMFNELGSEKNVKIFFPQKILSTDNAAMVGLAADYYYKERIFSNIEESVNPNLALKFS